VDNTSSGKCVGENHRMQNLRSARLRGERGQMQRAVSLQGAQLTPGGSGTIPGADDLPIEVEDCTGRRWSRCTRIAPLAFSFTIRSRLACTHPTFAEREPSAGNNRSCSICTFPSHTKPSG